jgi:hypothetical protein
LTINQSTVFGEDIYVVTGNSVWPHLAAAEVPLINAIDYPPDRGYSFFGVTGK